MNEILFFGQNSNPQLFKNEYFDIKKPTQFQFEKENEDENEKKIKQISSGNFGTIFLFENGTAFEYYSRYYGSNPKQKIEIGNIQKASVGYQNQAVLTKEGNVFAKGKDINQNNPNQFINISSLIEDPNDRIIEDVVCANRAIYLLTSNQKVYGFGSNDLGQLSFDYETNEKTEKPNLMMKGISKIFSGNYSNHVFLLNSNQELFSCGFNYYGQLGLGKSKKETQIDKLSQVQNIPKGKIIDIQCGVSFSVMMIENENENPKRKLYSCGNAEYNGLGIKKETYEFTEIKCPLFENDHILEFSVGSNHTLILTSKGKLILFGNNANGQLGVSDEKTQKIPIQIELPKLIFDKEISNYHIYCGYDNSFLYYSPFFSAFSNLEEDLIKLFRRKEFCNISFKTENGEIIEAHKLILKYRLKPNQINQLEEILLQKSIKESNQIFEMIYSSRSKINPKLYLDIKEIINSNEKIEETMKRICYNENENENEKDFIIERNGKQIKFPKLILIMRSELYRGMFLSVNGDKSNQVTDSSGISDEAFEILEYWIYSNQIKKGIQITQQIIGDIERGIDYFQLNQTNPNLFDLLTKEYNIQEKEKEKEKEIPIEQKKEKKKKCSIF
ncbi:hypothetical protein M0811_02952 [Anaeramoeba ignava]|uniref:BTB domain-containing protein n=1 Tax=Anaeramoeba ignava TaxID=1746090 RepID=A0A9Q0L7G8_ANAIG|nr:hypothetical protein M0811_02952 [Anaeramoeba ignava]